MAVRARLSLCCFLLLAALAAVRAPRPAVAGTVPAYSITALALPTPSQSGYLTAVNGSGQVVGWSGVNGSSRGFLLQDGAGAVLPPHRRDIDSHALGINDRGVVVGYSRGAFTRGVLWKKGKPKLLKSLRGLPYSTAHDVNDRGQIVGDASKGQGDLVPVLWKGSSARKLPVLPGATRSLARAINNRGQIVGYSGSGQISYACSWERGRITKLPLVGGYTESSAEDLNEAGQVVGSVSQDSAGPAVVWQEGLPSVLPGLGGPDAGAKAINEAGLIVGIAQLPSGVSHAVLWREGQVYDLNDLIPTGSGWILESALNVNDQGWIVGTGQLNFQDRTFLLRPLP